MRLLSKFIISALLPFSALFGPAAALAQDAAPAPAAQMTAPAAQSSAVDMRTGLSRPQTADERALIERGRYLAIASDCTACHTAHDGGKGPFSGGYIFKMPMGQIVSSNITPSREFGIGTWSEADFARAVRDGVRPNGMRLYPAMPYTEYSVMTDDDMKALYAYFMNAVPAVDAAPSQKTSLNFPFNMPGAMLFWDTLFLNHQRFQPDANASAEINRGRYLVDGPAHCGTCHTPRNFMLAPDSKNYLGGGAVSGWWAPNITPDPVGGIGGWSEQEVVNYLKTGHVRDKSQANGPMAEAVEFSFRYMNDADLRAIAAYLRTVPPLPSKGQTEPAYAAHQPKDTSFAQYEFPLAGAAAPASSDVTAANGAVLYNTACASCHGVNGDGGGAPSLLQNRAVGIANPDSLIMTVAYGLYREGAGGRKASMPGFLESATPIADAMTPAQIAAVVTYVRNNFGGSSEVITEADVNETLAGGKMPFMIAHAALLAAIGAIIALLIVIWLIHHFLFSKKRFAEEAEEIAHKAEAEIRNAAEAVSGKAKAAAGKTADKLHESAREVKSAAKDGKVKAAAKAETELQSAKESAEKTAAAAKKKVRKPKKKSASKNKK